MLTKPSCQHITIWIKNISLCLWISLLWVHHAAAQSGDEELALARQYSSEQAFDKAIKIYQTLYEQAPFDKRLYDEYYETLVKAQAWDTAVALGKFMQNIRKEDPGIYVDIGYAYAQNNQSKLAQAYYDSALVGIDGNDFITQQVAKAFEQRFIYDWAAKTYEKAKKEIAQPFVYATELILLYHKLGDAEKAWATALDMVGALPQKIEEVKESIASSLEDNDKSVEKLHKLLKKKMQTDSDNPVFTELFIWLNLKNGDYESSIRQMIQLDKKYEEQGDRLLRLAQDLNQEDAYDAALKAVDYVIKLGEASPNYEAALFMLLQIKYKQLRYNKNISLQEVQNLVHTYDRFFEKYPDYYSHDIVLEYAAVLAQYARQTDRAIELLNKVINTPGTAKALQSMCKLHLGDYYIIKGEVWESTLLYAQVDKDHRNDFLGEEARFKNAKLAYYRGDFEWAQSQLTVLKASTSDLIANDALQLSVLITENTPADSNMTPLLLFAKADLLLFQHQNEDALKILDSIILRFPDTELQDDILMLKAAIYTDQGQFNEAIQCYQSVIKDYGEDVLADDALLKLAQLSEWYLKDYSSAKLYYEKIILNFSNSTYVQLARTKYQEMLQKEKHKQPN